MLYIYTYNMHTYYIHTHTHYICIYVDNVYYSAIKHEKSYIIFSNMNGQFILSEVRNRKRNIM